jgi:protein phosphatase
MLQATEKTLQLDSAAFTDPGTRRTTNQDTIFHQTSRNSAGNNVGLFLVCDGMGGHQGGEVASRIAVDTITAELADLFVSEEALPASNHSPSSLSVLRQKITMAVGRANTQIRQYAQQHPDQTPDLGTTLTLMIIYGSTAHIINAGDGRVYGWRRDQLTQITRDHSLAAVLAEGGVIEQTKIAHHPQSHVILRALGIEDQLKVDVYNWEIQAGDKLLLCSDGLWKAFEEPNELEQRLAKELTAADLCQQLVSEARQRDGSDNISAIVVAVQPAIEC